MKLRNNILKGALQSLSTPCKHLKILSSALLTSACLLAISATTAQAYLSSDLEGAGWTVHNADLVNNLTGNGEAITAEQMDFDADDLLSGYGVANGLMSTSEGMLIMSPTVTVNDPSLYQLNNSWSSDLGSIYQFDLANDIENAYPAADGNYVNVNMKLISSEIATLDGSDAKSVIDIGNGITINAPETFTYKTSGDEGYREYTFAVESQVASSSSNLPNDLDTSSSNIELLNKDGNVLGVGTVKSINGVKSLNIQTNSGVTKAQAESLSNTLSYVDGSGNAQTYVQGSPVSYEMSIDNSSKNIGIDINKYPYLYVLDSHNSNNANVIGEAKLTRDGHISVSQFYDNYTKDNIGIAPHNRIEAAAILQCETPNCNITNSRVTKAEIRDNRAEFIYREPVVQTTAVVAFDGSFLPNNVQSGQIQVRHAQEHESYPFGTLPRKAQLGLNNDGSLTIKSLYYDYSAEDIRAGLLDGTLYVQYVLTNGQTRQQRTITELEGHSLVQAVLGEDPIYPEGQGLSLGLTHNTALVTNAVTGHTGMMLPSVMLINPDGSKDARWGSDAAVQFDYETDTFNLITDSANYVGGSGEYSLVLEAMIETVHAEKSLDLYGSSPSGVASSGSSGGGAAASVDAIVHNASWDQLAQTLGISLDDWVTGLSEVENKTEEQVQSQLSDLEESITACVTKIGTDLNSSSGGIGNYECETIAATSKIEKACWVDSPEQKALWIAFDEDSFVTIRERFLLLIPNQVDNGGNITYSFGVNELACLTNAQNSSFSLTQGENNELMGSIIGEGQKCAFTELDALEIDSPFKVRQDDGTLACEE